MPLSFTERIRRVLQNPLLIVERVYRMLGGVDIRQLKFEHRISQEATEALAAMAPSLLTVSLDSLVPEIGDRDTKELGELFSSYGSDKSTKHDYYRLYGDLLRGRREEPLRILEIGLGTNNTDIPSNMGKDGRPGASLRAFRDWGPRFEVYGADIDTRVLFSEERIETYFVDQTNPKSLAALAKRFPPASFDLIIDDGFHIPWANFNTIEALLPLLKEDGVLVVEDILEKYLRSWRIALPLLAATYTAEMIQCKKEIVCLVRPSRLI